MVNKALWNWQYHLRPSSTHQRLTQNRNTWKGRKNMEKVHCYWTTRLVGRLTRSGELKVSQHCSLSRCSSLWRADYSSWRIVTDFCREVRFFTPKTQFSSNPIPNLMGELNLWSFYNLNIYYTQFYGLSTLINNQFLHVLWSIPVLNPNLQIHKNNNKNYMLNSVSELHNLRLENVSPTLTLDWWLQDSTSSPFSWFSSPLSPKDFL